MGNKIKVTSAEIITVREGKLLYHEIKYFDISDDCWHTGFGTYDLDLAVELLETEFELVEDKTVLRSIADIIASLEERVKSLEDAIEKILFKKECDNCGHAYTQMSIEPCLSCNHRDKWETSGKTEDVCQTETKEMDNTLSKYDSCENNNLCDPTGCSGYCSMYCPI